MNIEKIKQSKTTEELLEFGIINIDKSSGPTSFDVSDFVHKRLNLRKTSHFGTLDPKVTGVLPIALNRACKLTGYFLGEDKEYVGVMRMHAAVDIEKIKEVIDDKFSGVISQKPPVRSRVKREFRDREIKSFELLEQDGKDIMFKTEVQGGTYIRKLIDDLGSELGIGAHMLELRRVRAGIFTEEQMVNLYDFEKAVEDYKNGDDKKLRTMIIPGEIVSELHPVVKIKEDRLKEIFTGKPIKKSDLVGKVNVKKEEIIVVFTSENKFIGIYKVIDGENIFAKALWVMQVMKG